MRWQVVLRNNLTREEAVVSQHLLSVFAENALRNREAQWANDIKDGRLTFRKERCPSVRQT